MATRTNDKKEQTLGIVLILMVVLSAVVLSSVNITTAFEKKCQASSIIVFGGKPYKCSPVAGDIKNDTNP